MIAALTRIQGEARRQLLMATTLYFGILFLEGAVGHVPILATNWHSLALLPVIILPLSLLALIAALLKPSATSEIALRTVMIVAALVGIVGFFTHLAANGVTLSRLGPLLSGAVFREEPGPTWPLAIVLGGVMGIGGGFGIATDDLFRSAVRNGPVRWLDKLAYLSLIGAIALSPSVATLGWCCALTVIACALLLINAVVGLIWLALTRSAT